MYSEQTAVSGGSLNFLDLTIEYRKRSEISVQFDDVPTAAWTWSGTVEHRILFNTPVPAGVVVKVLRDTDISEMTHVFSAGASFRNTTMDDDFLQLLHAVQELRERGGTGGGGGGVTGALNVGGGPAELFKQNALGVLQFRTLAAGPNVAIDVVSDVLTISAAGGGGGGVTDHGMLSGLADDDHTQYYNQARGDARYSQLGHTHALSTITVPGGSTVGHVATWNGTNLVLSAPSGGGGSTVPVIVYIGDSLSSDHPNLAESPAVQLERTLKAGGYDCKVVNLAVNGHSYYRANTAGVFGTQTVVQRAIALNPVAILVALGFNDTVMAIDGRSVAQAQTDASTFYSTLRTALPSIPIIAASELAYDKTNFTPATLKNRGVMPALMTLRSSGILNGCWSSEILEDTLSGTTQGRYADWVTLDTHVRSLGTITSVITLDIWKIARLGLTSADGLHLTNAGSRLIGTTWRKAFNTLTSLQTLAPNLRTLTYGPFDGFMNPDGTIETGGLFDLLLSPSGSDWTLDAYSNSGQHTNHQGGPWTHCNPAAWFLPSKGAYKPSTLAYTTGTTFTWELRNVAPSTDVQSSIDGGAYTTIGQTTHLGDYMGSGILPLTAGTYVFRYKVANEVHGPVSLVVTAGSGGGSGWTPKTISGANLTSNFSYSSGVVSNIPYDTANIANSDAGYWAFTNPGGNERRLTLTPPGGSLWVRLAFSAVVSPGVGAPVELGFGVYDAAMVLQYRIVLCAVETAGNTLTLGGSFVGRFSTQTTFVPYVFSNVGGSVQSNQATGRIGTYWSGEVINN